MDILGAKATIEPNVNVVLENGVITRFDDARAFRSIGQLAVVIA